jgi:hypothetical protein
VSISSNGHRESANGSRPGDALSGDLERLIGSLRTLFAKDRAIASQLGSARCGICYLYFQQSELVYRDEEGFYICDACARGLGSTPLHMVRRQQR